jgi:G protein-coupled receptor 107
VTSPPPPSLFFFFFFSGWLSSQIETYYLEVDGHPGSFATIYFLFTFLKGVFMFVVIALIGSGWSLLKPFLSDRDKKIFLVIISLQILDNLALVVVEETAPGSKGWFTAKDIFRLIDIVCCGAILIPLISSIQHLKDAAQVDDKAAANMNKLQLFRQFYLTVVGYVYFTRIIIYLLDATLPFRLSWIGPLITEMATLLFYLVTG